MRHREGPCASAVRRWPSTGQGERSHQKPNFQHFNLGFLAVGTVRKYISWYFLCLGHPVCGIPLQQLEQVIPLGQPEADTQLLAVALASWTVKRPSLRDGWPRAGGCGQGEPSHQQVPLLGPLWPVKCTSYKSH